MNKNYIPETLEQCKQHYIPPVKQYGHLDGMNGACHWCKEMCPYQFEMCWDESWLKNLAKTGQEKKL